MNSPSNIISTAGWLTVIAILVGIILDKIVIVSNTWYLVGLIAVISLMSSLASYIARQEALRIMK